MAATPARHEQQVAHEYQVAHEQQAAHEQQVAHVIVPSNLPIWPI